MWVGALLGAPLVAAPTVIGAASGADLAAAGFSTLLLDYRGYGGNPGYGSDYGFGGDGKPNR